MIDEFANTILVYNQEADDQMGIDQYNNKYGESIICSIDKDMDMIPGLHFNHRTNLIYEVGDPGHLELSDNHKKLTGGGYKWFYAQMLLGDTADNIPGISGFGPVRVHELLNRYEKETDLVRVVYEQYLTKYRDATATKQIMAEIGDLLWIRRHMNQKKSTEILQLISQV